MSLNAVTFYSGTRNECVFTPKHHGASGSAHVSKGKVQGTWTIPGSQKTYDAAIPLLLLEKFQQDPTTPFRFERRSNRFERRSVIKNDCYRGNWKANIDGKELTQSGSIPVEVYTRLVVKQDTNAHQESNKIIFAIVVAALLLLVAFFTKQPLFALVSCGILIGLSFADLKQPFQSSVASAPDRT